MPLKQNEKTYFKGSKNPVFFFRGRSFAMTFANYCFIAVYCTSTGQSCDTNEPVLVTMGFDPWQRELNTFEEHCCDLYNNIATDIWVWSFRRAFYITRPNPRDILLFLRKLRSYPDFRRPLFSETLYKAGGKCIEEIFSDCRMRARWRRWGTLTLSRWTRCAAKGFSHLKQRWVLVPHQLTNCPVIVFIKRGWRAKPGLYYDIKTEHNHRREHNGSDLVPRVLVPVDLRSGNERQSTERSDERSDLKYWTSGWISQICG